MDMHIPHALLKVAQEPRPYRIADRPDYFFSEQLSATYEAANHALWIRWTPTPRPSFNPEVLRSLDRCAQFIRANDGFIRSGDGFAPHTEDTPEAATGPMPIEYTVLCSGVPGVFNLGGDLDLFVRLIGARDRAALVEYGTACIHVLFQNYCAHDLPITTISLVQGDCLGGGFEAALSSDFVVAEKHVRFGFPEIMFNLFPGMGAYSFLDRRVGRRVTEELLSTGKTYSADDMLAMGVIDRVAASGAGEAEVAGLMRRQSRNRNGLLGIASARRRVNPVTFQ
jgi:DSF synthase